jgi:predicted site-specific integrase-resolvase
MSKAKTRQEIANELGISTKILRRWIKDNQLFIPAGILSEKYQKLIYATFGSE